MDFDESKVRRDDHGRFSETGASSGAKSSSHSKELNDVTSEYKSAATPKTGTIQFEPGYDISRNREEVKIAGWIYETFGGDITLLAERDGQKNPDYKWNGKLWDLKTPEEIKFSSIQRLTRTGIHQIESNPGGIIVDLGDRDDIDQVAESAVAYRASRSANFDFDAIIVRKRNEYKVLRFKK